MNLETVGIIGAGTMGNGIAQVCAVAGLNVIMVDVNTNALSAATVTITGSLERLVTKGKLGADDKIAALGRITSATRLEALAGAGIVIEAATENLELKCTLLKDVEKVLGPDAILASNTSSISITKLAGKLRRPANFIGMHFFNPVPLMSLVELIRGLQTSDETHVRIEALAAKLGKTSITVRNGPGFAVNRILCPMINEAIFALAEGLATAEDIDTGMRLGCNHPIGPLALADMIGLDTLLAVLDMFYEGFRDSKYRAAPLLREYVEAGYLGRKSGRGFYTY
ncbi:3-hydroxybutyryl-CoA dehydrogenase [Telluria sp. Tellsp104]